MKSMTTKTIANVCTMEAFRYALVRALLFSVFLSLLVFLNIPLPLLAQTKVTLPTKPALSVSNANLTTTSASLTTTNATTSTNAASQALRALVQEKQGASTASIRLFAPMREHGRMMLTSTQAFVTIEKRNQQWQDYTGLPDMLAERLPATFPLFLGLQGAYNHLAILGAGTRDVAVTMNGRSIRNVALGATFLEQLPPEMAEQTEVFIGSDAAILASNAAGALINVQEVRHDTKNLYTRIWYQQFGDQFTAADVDISYNAAPNLNITLGARTQNANRLYNNTGSRLWNVRVMARWNPSSTASLTFSYLGTQQRLTANGGLISTVRPDVITSATIFNELQENTLRHDFTLTGSAFLTRDSSIAATLSAYTSIDGRALERSSLQGAFTAATQARGGLTGAPDVRIAQATSTNVTVGATGRIETHVSLFSALEASLLAGGTVELHSIPSSIYWDAQARANLFRTRVQGEVSGFGRLGFQLSKSLDVSGGARLTILGAYTGLSLGAKVALNLIRSTSANLQFWADVSRSSRLPSLSEVGAAALSFNILRPEEHLLGLAGLRFYQETAQSTFSSDIVAFWREIRDPIIYQIEDVPLVVLDNSVSIPIATVTTLATVKAFNGSTRTILGASVTMNWHVKNILFGGGLVVSSFANGTLSQTDGKPDRRLPLLYAGATAQYEYIFGRDVLRAGVRVRVMTPFVGERFSPMLWAYVPASEEQGLTGNGIDVVAGAEVFGSLFIRATYQNALNLPTFTVAGYPQFPSVLRFTVSATILGN